MSTYPEVAGKETASLFPSAKANSLATSLDLFFYLLVVVPSSWWYGFFLQSYTLRVVEKLIPAPPSGLSSPSCSGSCSPLRHNIQVHSLPLLLLLQPLLLPSPLHQLFLQVGIALHLHDKGFHLQLSPH